MSVSDSGDQFCYSVENLLLQVRERESDLGRHVVRFHVKNGRPSRTPTGDVEDFFYYPSGGTIRDRDLNILFYEPKLDKYHPSNREGGGKA